ncbi:MAG: DUF427 domain-containing protein [Actinobacteria bacterium]|nr:DUF427 domain-containing protein [Actinomycetota bacterium]
MALRLGELLLTAMSELRIEPTSKHVRARLDGAPVLDTTRALIVWEPARVVPGYAVPEADMEAELVEPVSADDGPAPPIPMVTLGAGGPRVIESADFALHTTPGAHLTVRVGPTELVKAAFRPDDPDLAGYVLVDFDAFDWLEEEEPIRGHPRDPLHRVDVRRSARHVRIELDGTVLADSRSPRLVFETKLSVRYYLPREDVRMELLHPSPTRSICAYKGCASYFTLELGDRTVADVAWSYEQPLPDAAELTGYLSFFDERVDVIVDGHRRDRPQTPWSDPDPQAEEVDFTKP